jgi:hypothetical protein
MEIYSGLFWFRYWQVLLYILSCTTVMLWNVSQGKERRNVGSSPGKISVNMPMTLTTEVGCAVVKPPLCGDCHESYRQNYVEWGRRNGHRIIPVLTFTFPLNYVMSRDSSVGIALGYGLGNRGSRLRFPAGLGIFLFITASIMALGPTQPPIQWVPGVLSLGVKRPGHLSQYSD